MIFELEEGAALEMNGSGPFMLFFTGEKTYHLREAAPVFQNAKELLKAAKLGLAAIDEVIKVLVETEDYEPAESDYEARAALFNAIKACK